MKLRNLYKKDAPFMLEWMHDETVVKYMAHDFSEMTIEDCEEFISCSKGNKKNIHLAIADDDDNYMGTVSLKNITENTAEFAITIRKKAMKKGYSCFAIKEIIKFAFNDLNLSSVYWYVSKNNERAINFYNKNGYHKIEFNKLPAEIKKKVNSNGLEISSYIWYFENK